MSFRGTYFTSIRTYIPKQSSIKLYYYFLSCPNAATVGLSKEYDKQAWLKFVEEQLTEYGSLGKVQILSSSIHF